MAEQFSDEYRAYMQSDKAAALQNGHQWDIGDWIYWYSPADLDKWRTEKEIVCLTIDDVQDMEVIDGNYWWLPTLFQLIRMIEGSGYFDGSEAARTFEIIGPSWDFPDWYIGDQEGIVYYTDKDLMLAAAQMAVRAIEEDGLKWLHL